MWAEPALRMKADRTCYVPPHPALAPEGGEGIAPTPSPLERERAGVRVAPFAHNPGYGCLYLASASSAGQMIVGRSSLTLSSQAICCTKRTNAASRYLGSKRILPPCIAGTIC